MWLLNRQVKRNTTFVKKYYTEDIAPQTTDKNTHDMDWEGGAGNEQAAESPTQTHSEGIRTEPLAPKQERPHRQIKLPQKFTDFILK